LPHLRWALKMQAATDLEDKRLLHRGGLSELLRPVAVAVVYPPGPRVVD
jgi:hypothetical protein